MPLQVPELAAGRETLLSADPEGGGFPTSNKAALSSACGTRTYRASLN